MPERSDKRQNTNTAVTRMYKRMLALDTAYAETPTPEVHARLRQAQRDYYRELLHYYRAIYAHRPHELRSAFMSVMVKRARQNRKQQLDDPDWQELALHQYRRVWRQHQRALAIREVEDPPAPKPERHRAPKPTHKRVRHPVTLRWVMVPLTPEEAAAI